MSDFDLENEISEAGSEDDSDESEVERAPPPGETNNVESEEDDDEAESTASETDSSSSGSAFTSDDDSPFASDTEEDPFEADETPDASGFLDEVDEDKEPDITQPQTDEPVPDSVEQDDAEDTDTSDEGETSDETDESAEDESDNADNDSDEEPEEEVVSEDLEEDLAETDESDGDTDDGDTDEDETSVEWGGDGPAPNVDENGASESDSDTEPEEDSMSDNNGSSGIDVKSIASEVMTAPEAANTDERWSVMVWADPGQGKTHFAASMPSPVVIIDTEGKAEEVTGKWAKKGQYKDPFVFQPSNYDEASEALTRAFKILRKFEKEEGVTGTIAVDSMSIMWDWAQQKYVDKFYGGKDKSEVDFDSAMGQSGSSDWKVIKRLHNAQFRQDMLDTDYHLCWTAMREDDYEERMKGNRDADKPAGEKENVYKVDEVVRITEGPNGKPNAILNKSGKVKHRYVGLEYPDFDKHSDLVEGIREAELGQGSIKPLEKAHDVRIVEGSPYKDEDD